MWDLLNWNPPKLPVTGNHSGNSMWKLALFADFAGSKNVNHIALYSSHAAELGSLNRGQWMGPLRWRALVGWPQVCLQKRPGHYWKIGCGLTEAKVHALYDSQTYNLVLRPQLWEAPLLQYSLGVTLRPSPNNVPTINYWKMSTKKSFYFRDQKWARHQARFMRLNRHDNRRLGALSFTTLRVNIYPYTSQELSWHGHKSTHRLRTTHNGSIKNTLCWWLATFMSLMGKELSCPLILHLRLGRPLTRLTQVRCPNEGFEWWMTLRR
jgi:hypothetical protein